MSVCRNRLRRALRPTLEPLEGRLALDGGDDPTPVEIGFVGGTLIGITGGGDGAVRVNPYEGNPYNPPFPTDPLTQDPDVPLDGGSDALLVPPVDPFQ
jgi:hypothetical protein